MILGIVIITTGLFFTVGPLGQNQQARTVHAQSGLISSLGSGAAKGLGNCAVSVGAELLGGIAGNLLGGLLGGLSPFSVSVSDGGTAQNVRQNSMSRVVREGCLDALMYYAAREVLNQLADSTLAWVESGFTRWGQPGNPGHVRNLGDFLNHTTDSVFNEFYRSTALGREIDIPNASQICGTYKEDVMLALGRQHYADNPRPTGLQPAEDAFSSTTDAYEVGGITCPEESIGATATDAFFSGNFAEGGWDAFAYSVDNPDANPIGAYLNQQGRLVQRINQARDIDTEELSQGNGWMNAVACPEGGLLDDRTGKCNIDGELIDPVVQTPGSVVNDTINNVVGSDFRRLEMADEVNEIVGALVDQMVSGIVGAGGSNRQGLFDPELASRSDTLGNAQGNQTDSGAGNYRGRVPEEFINERLDEQLPLEQDLLDALEILPSTGDLARLEARINQCLSDNTFGTEQEKIQSELNTMQQTRLGILPSSSSGQQENEIGPQKVDWVGNDMSWSQGEIYGIERCGGARHGNAYGMSYIPDLEAGVWRGFICIPEDEDEMGRDDQSFGGNFFETDRYIDRIGGDGYDANPDKLGNIEFTDQRKLYRSPSNSYVKIDWEGADYDWRYYDMLAKEHPISITENVGDVYLVNNIIGLETFPLDIGYELNVPGPTPKWGGSNKKDQVINQAKTNDSFRYGTTECDSRTIGEKSYVVAPDQGDNPGNIVWTHQECKLITSGTISISLERGSISGLSLFRFVTMVEDGEVVTTSAYRKKDVVDYIDGYKQDVLQVLGDTDYSIGNYEAPTDGMDNLHELRFDFMTILPETTIEELGDDPLIATTASMETAITGGALDLPEDMNSNDNVSRRKRLIDSRFARMERRFHSEADLKSAQNASEQLDPNSTTSLYTTLFNRAETNGCSVPEGWTSPVIEDSNDDGGGVGGDSGDDPQIVSFEAYRRPSNVSETVRIEWQSNAESCQASSVPVGVWSGEKRASSAEEITRENSSTLILTCTTGNTQVKERLFVEPADSDGLFQPDGQRR